jgi:hypothetical protein
MNNRMSKALCAHERAIYNAQRDEDARADGRRREPRNVLGIDNGKTIFGSDPTSQETP